MFDELDNKTVKIGVSHHETLVRESENYKTLITGIIEAAKLGADGNLVHDGAVINALLKAVDYEYYSGRVETLKTGEEEFMDSLRKVIDSLTGKGEKE